MDIDKNMLQQIDKVLALADSNHEGEALSALRMARRMLSREGLTFTQLVQAARRGQVLSAQSFFSGGRNAVFEARLDEMQDELNAHVLQNENLTSQIEFWRRRAFELEQMLALNQAEAERWKEMARETAERLWDLGQMAQADAFVSTDPLPEEDLFIPETQEPLKAAG